MSAPFVTFVEANLKGGVRAALGQKTFIFGPNGSGKGAVQNAVELALTGHVTDVQGRREVAREIDLIAHLTPDRKGELLARAVLSDGSECVWRAGGKKKTAVHEHPKVVVPELALPLRPVYGAITGAVETARKFFLEYAVGNITDKDILAYVPQSLHAYYGKATMATTLSTFSAVDRLLAAMEQAKKKAREANDRAKAAAKLSDENAQGLSPLPTEQDEKALKDAVKEAEKRLDAAKALISKAEALSVVGDRLRAARQEKTETEERLQAATRVYEEAVDALRTMQVPGTLDPDVQAVIATLKAHAHAQRHDCLVCGSQGPFDFALRLQRVEAWVIETTHSARVYDEAAKRVANAEIEVSRARQMHAQANSNLSAIEQASSPLSEAPPTPEYVAGCEQTLTQLRDKQRANDVLKATWAGASKARDNAQQALDEAGEWKKLHEACVGAIAKLLDAGVANFTARVQQHLPPEDQFRITLREGERAVFQFGLVRDASVRTALSGAEWARVTAALAAVCTPPEKVAVVIPEDRGFDPDTLARVLTAFQSIEAQVIFAAPIEPRGGVPAGWTVIDTTTEAHRKGESRISMVEAPAVPLLFG